MSKKYDPRLLILAVSIFIIPTTYAGNSQCFNQKDSLAIQNGSKGIAEVIAQAAQPRFDGADYVASAFYPATSFASVSIDGNLKGTERKTGADGFAPKDYYWLWGNRCAFLQTPSLPAQNITPAHPANKMLGCEGNIRQTPNGNDNPYVPQNDTTYPRTIFSTYNKADLCTRMQLQRILHGPNDSVDRLDTIAANGGLTLYDLSRSGTQIPVPRDLAKLVVNNDKTDNYFVDLCILAPNGVSTDTRGVVVDWEVFDNRDPQAVTAQMTHLAQIAHEAGKTLILMTNDLANEQGQANGVAFAHNGIDSTNISKLIDLTDGFAPVVWSGASLGSASGVKASVRVKDFASDWCAQKAFINPTPAQKNKIYLDVSLYDLQMNAMPLNDACGPSLQGPYNEAEWLHHQIVTEHYAGLMLWRNNTLQGGACNSVWTPDPVKFPTAGGISSQVNQSIACLVFGNCNGNYVSSAP